MTADVYIAELSPNERDDQLGEILSELALDVRTGRLEALIYLTVVIDERGQAEEKLRSVFDIIQNEESINILERWCVEARQLIRLHKEKPGGSS
jgi:hypothetical protein